MAGGVEPHKFGPMRSVARTEKLIMGLYNHNRWRWWVAYAEALKEGRPHSLIPARRWLPA